MRKFQVSLILITLFFLPVYLIKIKYGWISFNLLEALIGILFLVWMLNREKIPKLLIANYKLPAILIFSGLFLSVFANKNYYAGLGSIKGWFIFPIIFSIVFFDALKKNESLLKKSFFALFLSGAAVSVVGIACEIFGNVTFDGRLKIFWDSPNQLAMFLAVPFLIGIKSSFEEFRELVSRKEKAGLWKICMTVPGSMGDDGSSTPVREKPNFGILAKWLGSALIFLNLFFTKSCGAWLAVTISLTVVFWLKYKKNIQQKYAAYAGIILLLIAIAAGIAKFDQIKDAGARSSLASRIMIWKSAGLMIENNPLF